MDLFLDFSLFHLSDCLCMLLFVYARLPGCEACYYESLESADCQQGKLHFDHTFLYPILLFISFAPQIFAWIGLGTCGLVVVLEVGTYYL